jgi:hypothetical protein
MVKEFLYRNTFELKKVYGEQERHCIVFLSYEIDKDADSV